MKSNAARKFQMVFLTVLLVVLWCGAAAWGQNGYPEPLDDYVNDYADVLSQADAARIGKMFKKLEKETGIEAVAVTIDSMQEYDTPDDTFEAFATGLFNTWGVGRKAENNGVLILVGVGDRKCRIELGGGYGRQYDAVMKPGFCHAHVPKRWAQPIFLRGGHWLLPGVLAAACALAILLGLASNRPEGGRDGQLG